MKKLTFLIAALFSAGLVAQLQAEENQQNSTNVEVAALTPENKTVLLPQSKLQQIAAVTAPEIAPRLKKGAVAEFPELALKARIQGMVYARVLVDENGQVTQLGKIKGHAIFHESVATTAQKLHFAPAMQGNKAVKAWVNVPFSFEM
ncbi:MAG: TonB family protein [Planctomycetota bacterium]|jgi:TonB family protein